MGGLLKRRRRTHKVKGFSSLEMFRGNHIVTFYRGKDNLVGDIFIAAAQDETKTPGDQPKAGVHYLRGAVEETRHNGAYPVSQIFRGGGFFLGWNRFLLRLGQRAGQNRRKEGKDDQGKQNAD